MRKDRKQDGILKDMKFGTHKIIEEKKTVMMNITPQNFETEVKNSSLKQAVLVHFWSPRNAECKKITLLLEKLAKARPSDLKVTQLNIEAHPLLAAQFGISSVPAVFAFKDGRPVDGFAGLQTEARLTAFINNLCGPPRKNLLQKALSDAQAALEAHDITEAAQGFAFVLGEDKNNGAAIAGLARCYFGLGDEERANQTLSMAPEAALKKPPLSGVVALLKLAGQRKEAGSLSLLQEQIRNSPEDFEARFALSIALEAENERAGAIEQLIYILKKNRDWKDGQARQQLITFFEIWGPMNPHSINGRRQLSTLLFS
ncbi:MAG: tetratricopeptide repeat protein [Alphaproteobacteria bacterium]|nr:tetratricopeptide repeat protein [Alphaproteobacteria bacterium]